MKRTLIPYFAAILLFCTCTREPAPENGGGAPVLWNVSSVGSFATKALVESTEQMERSCTDESLDYTFQDGTALKGLGQKIGIWADYRIESGSSYTEVKDIFNGTTLEYDLPDRKWDYYTNPAYWVIGGQYAFRAYYPAGELNISEQLSSAKSLVIEMNTATTQRDMLLAYNSFDTVTGLPIGQTEGDPKTLHDPVQLDFRHAMAALRLRFKFIDNEHDGIFYSEDKLTSCWFEADEEDAFAMTGYLIYGDGTSLEKEGNINWRYQYYPEPGLPFYRWKPEEGISFWNRNIGDTFEKSSDQKVATAYTVNTTGDALIFGSELVRHNGWITILPQKSTGHLRLCFTTEDGGESIFSVTIPKETGTARAIYEKYPDNPEYQSDPAYQTDENGNRIPLDDFVPGWRYTYTVAISKTHAEISLGIAPWNRLDSSFDIRFN